MTRGFESHCQGVARRWELNWFGQYRRVNGRAIHYVEAGWGPPVLLVHGFFAWSFTWRKNLGVLAEDFRAIAPDLAGFGLSQRSAAGRYRLDDQADLLAALLDAMGIDRAALVGHSMGGEIALRFALRHPDRATGLVLIAPSALIRRRQRWLERCLLPVPLVGPLAVRLAVMTRPFAARSVREAYHQAGQVTPADILGYWLPSQIPGSARTLARMLPQLDFGAASAHLPKIGHRTLIIWGENDPWIPPDHGRQLAELLPNSRLVTLPACGHVPHEEYPERFHQLLVPFLRSL